jgi:hypothetical protein
LTDCSYSIRIVHVEFPIYYYSNRVENMIEVTDCNELKN